MLFDCFFCCWVSEYLVLFGYVVVYFLFLRRKKLFFHNSEWINKYSFLERREHSFNPPLPPQEWYSKSHITNTTDFSNCVWLRHKLLAYRLTLSFFMSCFCYSPWSAKSNRFLEKNISQVSGFFWHTLPSLL